MSIETRYAETLAPIMCWWRSVDWPLERRACYIGDVVITEDDERVRAREHIESEARLYAMDRNPLHVWAAILDAERAHVAFPEWVRPYLASVARVLLWGAFRDKDGKDIPRERRPALIAEALGFKARGAGRQRDAYSEITDQRDLLIAGDLWMALARTDPASGALERVPYDEARDAVAGKHGVSESVVDRAYRRYPPSAQAQRRHRALPRRGR